MVHIDEGEQNRTRAKQNNRTKFYQVQSAPLFQGCIGESSVLKKYPQSFMHIHKCTHFKTAAALQQKMFTSNPRKVLSLASLATDSQGSVLLGKRSCHWETASISYCKRSPEADSFLIRADQMNMYIACRQNVLWLCSGYLMSVKMDCKATICQYK